MLSTTQYYNSNYKLDTGSFDYNDIVSKNRDKTGTQFPCYIRIIHKLYTNRAHTQQANNATPANVCTVQYNYPK